jgi:AraC family transcriptional regulator, L-rhamnose operon transcriptional activator RhaR
MLLMASLLSGAPQPRLHYTADAARPDGTGEPLIAAGQPAGVWRAEHWLSIAAHDHDFFEVALVLAGSGHHFDVSGEAPITRRSAIFIPPGVAHGYRSERKMTLINLFFRRELPDRELMWAARDEGLRVLFGPRGPDTEAAAVIARLEEPAFRQCILELETMDAELRTTRARAGVIGRLLIVLDLIARSTAPRNHHPDSGVPRAVSAAVELIEREPARAWSLAEMSAAVFIGPYHLAHEFKRWVGMSPIAYLHRRRAEVAAALLLSSDHSVAEIGRAVGWPHPASFSRQFRRAFGVSPREFRSRKGTASAQALGKRK